LKAFDSRLYMMRSSLDGGEIKVESEVGNGSEFIVSLNVSESAYSSSEKSLESITSEEIQKYNLRMKETIELIPDQLISTEQDNTDVKESILIVEDNKEMNDYLAEIFSKDYQVFRAYNGAEACKLLKKQLPDLIVSDVMMPVMDGLELTAYVKQDLNSSHIPVILLTAKTDELDHTQGYLKGADADCLQTAILYRCLPASWHIAFYLCIDN
jgi:CheY-like chemotaxis protein